MPGLWTKEKKLSNLGFASFFVKIKLPKKLNNISIKSKYSYSNYELFLLKDSKFIKILSNGRVSSVAEKSIPAQKELLSSELAPLLNEGSNEIILVKRISNFIHSKAGPRYSLVLGNKIELEKELSMKKALFWSLSSLLFFMGLYHFGLFLQRRKLKTNLFFSLTCLFACLSHIFGERILIDNFKLQEMIYFEWNSKFKYLSIYLSSLYFIGFFKHLIPSSLLDKKYFVLKILTFFFSALTLLTGLNIYGGIALSFYSFLLLTVILVLILLLAKCARNKNKIALYSLLSFLPLLICIFNDILHINDVLAKTYLYPYGFAIFILSQSFILSKIANKIADQAEYLSENLKIEVDRKTANLKAEKEKAERARKDAVMMKALAETKREEAERAHSIADRLKKAAEKDALKLKELDKQKTYFFQNISHELRTPLTLIMAPLEEALGQDPENQNIKVANKNSKRLYRLVNQLLDFQKISAGKRNLDLKLIEVNRFLSVCGEYFSAACKKKQIKFDLKKTSDFKDGTEEAIVLAEIDALEKIVFNFLSNALKYTPVNGDITLTARTLSNRKLEISVSDSGPGIAKNQQKKLFKVFSQIDSSSTREFEGTGLGLALAKDLAEKMKAEIFVESNLGEGSEFGIRIDLYKQEKQIKDLLIVDDDNEVLFSLENELVINFPDWNIDLVNSASKARDKFEEHKYKIILSDSRMPKESGVSLLKDIKERFPETRRLLITGFTDKEDLKAATNKAEIDAILYKPWELDELKAILEKAHSRYKSEQRSYSKAEEFTVKDWHLEKDEAADNLQISESSEKSDFLNHKTILIIDDLPDMRELVSNTLRAKGYRTLLAADGKSGLEEAKKHQPDLIISDWMMPVMSGPEMILKLRELPALKSIPVMLLTAKSDEESRHSAVEIGVNGFLGKPFNKNELLSSVENLLKLKERESIYKSELQLAASLQNQLNQNLNFENDSIKMTAHFESWQEIGGDFLIKEKLSEDHLFFAQVDVSGHGPQAALMAFYLRGLIDHHALSNWSSDNNEAAFLDLVIDKVRAQFSKKMDQSLFATFFFGLLNLNSGELYFRNGGHPRAVHVSTEMKISFLSPELAPFGIPAESEKKEIQTKILSPGEKLFVLNDSFTELQRKNKANSMLGTKGVSEIIIKYLENESSDAESFANFILQSSANHEIGYQDDCSVLLFEMK